MKVTKVTKIVTDIILALLAIYSLYFMYSQWTNDAMKNFVAILVIAVVMGGAKIAQAILLMITRGLDSIPDLFKK